MIDSDALMMLGVNGRHSWLQLDSYEVTGHTKERGRRWTSWRSSQDMHR